MKTNEKRLEVAEMRMLRWMTGKDKIRILEIRGTIRDVDISEKIQDRHQQW